jgi:Fur family peroxide stress response transcriptional regulator
MAKTISTKEKRLELCEALCRKKGLLLTVQRRVILETLLEREDHPTVDDIFEVAKERIPGVSRTTVYRVLEALVDLGVARKTSHIDAVVRYDGNIDHHHHLVCIECDKVVDFDDRRLSKLRLPDVRRTGFELVDFSVHFEGLCPDCRRTTKSRAPRERRQA